MDVLMNPENIALMLGALVALIGAVAFAIRQVSMAVNSWIETRNKVRVMEAEIVRLHAEADTRDQDAENENQTKIINILERLTDQNGRWSPIAEDFVTAQNRYAELFERFNQTSAQVAAGLSEVAQETKVMAQENKAMRISMESWAHAIDPNIEALSKKIEVLEITIGQVTEAIHTGNADHIDIRAALSDKVVPLLMDIHKLVQPPAPPPPADKHVPAEGKILNADAGDHSAVKLPKTG